MTDHVVQIEVLLDMLENVIRQACQSDGRIDSMSISIYAEAIRLLAAHGRLMITHDVGRRVIAVPVRTPPDAEEQT